MLYQIYDKICMIISYMNEMLKIITKTDICNICDESKLYFSICPYFNDHKWCEDCNYEIEQRCPFCRREFKKVLEFPTNYLDMLSDPIFINRKI